MPFLWGVAATSIEHKEGEQIFQVSSYHYQRAYFASGITDAFRASFVDGRLSAHVCVRPCICIRSGQYV